MNSKHLDTERLQYVLSGELEPETAAEKYMLIAYERGKLGDLLANLIDNFPVDYFTLKDYQKDLISLGYAVGQQYYVKEEMKRQIKGPKH